MMQSDPSTASNNVVLVQTRLSPCEHDRLEDWRRSQPRIPSISDALRVLLRHALHAERRPRGAGLMNAPTK
jgi:hypothetical protein